MADCGLWLSGGSRLQTRTNHYIISEGTVLDSALILSVCMRVHACACVCEGVCVSPAGDFICSHSLDLCR